MQDIFKIDTNFAVETVIKKDGMVFYNANQPPFVVYGVSYDNGMYHRMPEAIAETVSESVYSLQYHTAGGRVRFKTDSAKIAIITKQPKWSFMPHFAISGAAGFDLYVRDGKERYAKTFVPPADMTDGYESMVSFPDARLREITIHMPLYSRVSSLYIGVEEGSVLEAPTPYRVEKPVVYYGSSITQGGCASRPGNSYESIISRRLDINYVNLGFSGHALAEPEIVEYISKLDMSVFVLDYDHNAPTVEHLQNTHEPMFRAVRQSNPQLPIVIMSRPVFDLNKEGLQRLEIIRQTYLNAKAAGDENVYFIDGPTLMAMAGYEGTVDGCHPNDLGFASMAKALGDVLETIL